MEKIKSFTDLNVWQKGHNLVLTIYKITRKFPQEEKFSLVDQMRRAAISITSNIAEGFSRNTYKDKVNFYCMSLGSLTEIQNQLLVAKDLNFIQKEIFHEIAQQTVIISKLLNGLIKSSRYKIHDS